MPRDRHKPSGARRRTAGPPRGARSSRRRRRLPELGRLRYERMAESPFSFFRGAAAVMAMDLATTPTTGVYVQACGDAHVNNFGFFASPERNLVFDINDFDETIPGPWEWDVKRLCASLHVVARQRGLRPGDADAIVMAAARTYRTHLADYATWDTLDLFYERTEIRRVVEHFPIRRRSGVVREIKRARRKDHLRAVAKLTHVVDGRRRFLDDPPLLVHLEQTGHGMDEVKGLIEDYRSTLTDDRRYMFDRFELLDVARKVVGVGSVGTRCWIALMAGRGEPRVRLHRPPGERGPASVLRTLRRPLDRTGSTPSAWSSGNALSRRPATSSWAGPKDPDGPAATTSVNSGTPRARGIPWTWTSGPSPATGALCAWVLARSHARTGDAVMISAYLGKGAKFDRAIAEFSRAYAITNEADHRALVEAKLGDRELTV